MRYGWSVATLALLAIAHAKITQLQKDCQSAGALYGVGKCWVWHSNSNWASAFVNCNDLGRKGHLPYLATSTEREFSNSAFEIGKSRAYLNLRQNRTQDNNTVDGWQWIRADGGVLDAVDVAWRSGQPTDDPADPEEMYAMYTASTDGIKSVSHWRNVSNYYCVYDDLDRVQQYTLHMQDRLAYSISDEGQTTKVDCALACRKHELCASFSWKTTDGHCVLSPDDGNFTISAAVNATDYEWFVAVYNFS